MKHIIIIYQTCYSMAAKKSCVGRPGENGCKVHVHVYTLPFSEIFGAKTYSDAHVEAMHLHVTAILLSPLTLYTQVNTKIVEKSVVTGIQTSLGHSLTHTCALHNGVMGLIRTRN